jgi:hypothetical protein
MKSMVMVRTCVDDQALDFEKKKEKNKMGKAKVISIGPFCFW